MPPLLLVCALITSGVLGFAQEGTAGLTQGAADREVLVWSAAGEITREDLDHFLLYLPPETRSELLAPLRGDRAALEELVVHRALLAKSRVAGLGNTADFKTERRLASLTLIAQACLRQMSVGLAPPGKDELREQYFNRREDFNLPSRRDVYHIYIAGGAAQAEEVEAKLSALRQKVLSGASFTQLAERFSDSESRHRGGRLFPGMITRKQLPEALADIVFELPEKTPSEPVMTSHGGHIFWVSFILPAQNTTFENARATLLEDWRKQVEVGHYRELGIPQSLWHPTAVNNETLATSLRKAEEASIVANLQDGPLTLGELRVVGPRYQEGTTERPGELLATLHRLRLMDAVKSRCKAQNRLSGVDIASRLQAWEESRLVARQRKTDLEALAAAEIPSLQDFYTSNIGYFSTPPKWRLQQLSLPLEDGGVGLFRELEAAVAAESASLAQLEERFGGEVKQWPLASAAELARIWYELPSRVARYRRGDVLPPVKVGNQVAVFEVIDYHVPEPIPFSLTQDAVASLYAAQHAGSLYQTLKERILREQEARFVTGGAVIGRGAQ